jgi:hypothetical protein
MNTLIVAQCPTRYTLAVEDFLGETLSILPFNPPFPLSGDENESQLYTIEKSILKIVKSFFEGNPQFLPDAETVKWAEKRSGPTWHEIGGTFVAEGHYVDPYEFLVLINDNEAHDTHIEIGNIYGTICPPTPENDCTLSVYAWGGGITLFGRLWEEVRDEEMALKKASKRDIAA